MRIACVLGDGYEDSEFQKPCDAFREAGMEVVVIGEKSGTTLAGKGGTSTITTEMAVAEADPTTFDALFVPGGYSPDHIRGNPDFLAFTKAFGDGRPILAICHGPQLLSSADVIGGRRLTAWTTVQTDLHRMGENVVDEEVVVDAGLVTSRKPDDIPAFIRESLQLLKVPAGAR